MQSAIRTTRKAAAAFLAGLLSVGCGVLALAFESDLLLVGVALFAVAAVVLGVLSRGDFKRDPERTQGSGCGCWAIALTLGGVALGFLVLPAT